jgi:hypothetical protein
VALALVGLAAAVFSLQGGTSGLSLPQLAELVHLGDLRHTVGEFLGRLEASGSVAVIPALAGAGAVLVGVLLLAGALIPRRERLVQLVQTPRGSVMARRRPLSQIAAALVEQERGVTEARAKVRPRRRSGGRIKVRAYLTRPAAKRDLQVALRQRLAPVTEPFNLKPKIVTRLGRRGSRVQ